MIKSIAVNEPVQDLLAVLTAALGPLTRPDLKVLVPGLFAGWAADTFDDEVLPKIRRVVTGTGQTGYAFAHPRLRKHLATPKHVPSGALESARKKLLGYCRDWAQHDSLYALSSYPSHLGEADPSALAGLYHEAGYLSAAISTLGIDRVTSTLRRILSQDLPTEQRIGMTRSLQLLDREAHHLRPPYPVTERGYVARQLGLRP